MKLKMSAFLIKEGVSRNNVLAQDATPNHTTFEHGGLRFDFYYKESEGRPKWLTLFSGITALDVGSMKSKGIQGLLVVERQNRVFCFTFGHARHLIDQLAIERYFGLKAALSLSDPELIKSIDKSNIDKSPLRSRSQSSQCISIAEFEFKFDWEILKSLTGVVDNESDDHDQEIVTGSDSATIFTDITLDGVAELADRLFAAYTDDGYKTKYPWIDYIVPVRDGTIKNELDKRIIARINAADFDNVWIAPPEIIDFANFNGYCYKHRRTKSSQGMYHDLHLQQCLVDKHIDTLDIGQAKATQIYLHGGDDQQLDSWPLYVCLNGEVELDDKIYILNEGDWYQVERNFVASVNAYFDQVARSDLVLPAYDGHNERPYLEMVAGGGNFLLMDQNLVKPDGASSSIEFCDLLTRDGHLIHVKKYSSSSVLSHLFSQAFVAAETLLHSQDIVAKVNEYLPSGAQFTFDPSRVPRRNKIVFAIMQQRAGDLHMPFFSKVNLRQYTQKLRDMSFQVELLKIPY